MNLIFYRTSFFCSSDYFLKYSGVSTFDSPKVQIPDPICYQITLSELEHFFYWRDCLETRSSLFVVFGSTMVNVQSYYYRILLPMFKGKNHSRTLKTTTTTRQASTWCGNNILRDCDRWSSAVFRAALCYIIILLLNVILGTRSMRINRVVHCSMYITSISNVLSGAYNFG